MPDKEVLFIKVFGVPMDAYGEEIISRIKKELQAICACKFEIFHIESSSDDLRIELTATSGINEFFQAGFAIKINKTTGIEVFIPITGELFSGKLKND